MQPDYECDGTGAAGRNYDALRGGQARGRAQIDNPGAQINLRAHGNLRPAGGSVQFWVRSKPGQNIWKDGATRGPAHTPGRVVIGHGRKVRRQDPNFGHRGQSQQAIMMAELYRATGERNGSMLSGASQAAVTGSGVPARPTPLLPWASTRP